MDKQKILFVSHCVLNTAAKVEMFDQDEMQAEENLRRRFVHRAVDMGIQLIQLPCPEFSLYGCLRWGHVSDQFDNPFFRKHCKQILEPVFLELEEYLLHPERFEVLGFVGIDGSPSCGVDYTCRGPWGGNLGGRNDLAQVVGDVRLVSGRGILFQQIAAALDKRQLDVKLVGLFAPEEEKVLSLLG